MDLYFSPLACSMASRIVIYETGGKADFHRVDTKTKRTVTGGDYLKINPKGLVPAVRTDDGRILTENAAILPYLADAFSGGSLAGDGFERSLVQQWLSFIGTELHTGVFHPLFAPTAAPEVKAFARAEAVGRLTYLNDHLAGREWLTDRFTVADAYAAAVLNWAQFVKLDLAPYPNIVAYVDRLKARSSVAKALREEFELFQAA